MDTTVGRLLRLLPAVESFYRWCIAANAAMSVLMIVHLYMHGAARPDKIFRLSLYSLHGSFVGNKTPAPRHNGEWYAGPSTRSMGYARVRWGIKYPIRGINMSNNSSISSNPQKPPKTPENPRKSSFFTPPLWGAKKPQKKAQKTPKKGRFLPPPQYYINP